MKTFFSWTLLPFIFFVTGCTSQVYISSSDLEKALATKNFIFTATRANPINQDVTSIVNSIPTYSSERLYQLHDGYQIAMKPDLLNVVLPYFGRIYQPSIHARDTGFNFQSKDFEYTFVNVKKGYVVSIVTRDKANIQKIRIDISPKGSAVVSIDATDRSSISYTGYISAPSER